MSDVSQGPGWWQASDGKWYPPEAVPGAPPPPPTAPPPTGPPPRFAGGTYPPAADPPASYPPDSYPPASYPPAVVARGTNGLAVASLVLSILWLWGVGSVLAIIFAVIGRRQIRESRGTQGGDGLAVAGLVIGIVGLVGTVLAILLLFAIGTSIKGTINGSTVSAQCETDARVFETAVAAYNAVEHSYPPAGNGEVLTTPVTAPGGGPGGPFLSVLAPTTHYTIWTDGHGGVFVYPPSQTTPPPSFSADHNFDTGTPCQSFAS